MVQHAKRSSEEWNGLVELWRRSGATQRGFCRDEGISYSAFSYWLRKTAETPSDSLVKIGAASPDTRPVLTPRSMIVVNSRSIRLELCAEESEATMAKIFRALEGAACSSI